MKHRNGKRMRGVLVSVLATAMLLIPAIAFAVNPNSTTIPSTGQSLDIEITSPSDGATVPAGDPVTVEGLVGIGGLSADANVLYVVDVSGSTEFDSGLDCDGSADPTGDDFNGDSLAGSTLDCEISGVLALNDSLSALTGVDGGVVPFGSTAVIADVDPATNQQNFTTPLDVDNNTNSTPDLEEVLRSLDVGAVNLFTPFTFVSGTNFDNALSSMNTAFGGQPAAENNVAFFLSDGVGTLSTGPGSPLQAAVDAGTVVNTYSVGSGATGCGTTAGLFTIADQTGGTCTEVTDPTTLAAALGGTAPAGIDRVEVSIDGGTPLTATLDALGNFSATIPGSAITGPSHTITATVFATDPDNTSVTADITINVPQPEVAGDFDVLPTSCPNPFKLGHRGHVPAAILGSDTLDVADIDPSTIELTGPGGTAEPIRTSVEDVAGPDAFPEPEAVNDCGTDGPDGFDDLTLKFSASDFEAVLGSVAKGDVVIVEISAETFGGDSITGSDIVWIR